MALNVFEGRVLVSTICTILVPVSKNDRHCTTKIGPTQLLLEFSSRNMGQMENPILLVDVEFDKE